MPNNNQLGGEVQGNRVDRRTVLKSLGVGSIALSQVGQAYASETDDTVTIIATKRGQADGPDEVLRTKEVPRQWHQHQNKVRRLNEKITKRLSKTDAGKTD